MEFLFQHRLLITTGAAVSSSGSSRFISKNAAFFSRPKVSKRKLNCWLDKQSENGKKERKSPLPTSQIDWSERQDLEDKTCKQSTVRSVDQESAKKKKKKERGRYARGHEAIMFSHSQE